MKYFKDGYKIDRLYDSPYHHLKTSKLTFRKQVTDFD